MIDVLFNKAFQDQEDKKSALLCLVGIDVFARVQDQIDINTSWEDTKTQIKNAISPPLGPFAAKAKFRQVKFDGSVRTTAAKLQTIARESHSTIGIEARNDAVLEQLTTLVSPKVHQHFLVHTPKNYQEALITMEKLLSVVDNSTVNVIRNQQRNPTSFNRNSVLAQPAQTRPSSNVMLCNPFEYRACSGSCPLNVYRDQMRGKLEYPHATLFPITSFSRGYGQATHYNYQTPNRFPTAGPRPRFTSYPYRPTQPPTTYQRPSIQYHAKPQIAATEQVQDANDTTTAQVTEQTPHYDAIDMHTAQSPLPYVDHEHEEFMTQAYDHYDSGF